MSTLKYCRKAYLICIVPVILLFSSCNHEKVKLDDPTQDELSEINDTIVNMAATNTGVNLLQGSAAKGDTWESWENAFFSCFKDETFKKSVVYLGPSNLKYLGTIISKDKSETKRELTAIIPPQDLSQFITKGTPVKTCDLTKVKNLSINFFISAAFQQMTDSLGLALTKYDSIKITGGEWQIDEIRTDDFIDYINSHLNDKKIESYKKSL